MKKLFVAGVIVLFLGLAIAPSINANVDRRLPKSFANFGMNRVKVIVTEFKPDGSREATVVEITREQVNTLRNELKGAKNLDERLSVLKDYSLVPQHVTLEQFKVGMEEKAQRMVFTKDKIARSLSQDGNFKENFVCYVDGYTFGAFKAISGLSPLTGLINKWIWLYGFPNPSIPYVPSCDLIQLHVSMLIEIEAKNGTLPSFDEYGTFGRLIIVGFVGYYISIFTVPFLPSFFIAIEASFVGSAVYVGVRWDDWRQS